jgi:dienelactone hydrolase
MTNRQNTSSPRSPQVLPYGAWSSPITSDLIVAGTVGLSQPRVDGDSIYWIESRPQEKGRQVVVCRGPDGHVQDITPVGFNVRSRVHEYGGGDYTVGKGCIHFSNDADRRVYRQQPGGTAEAITAEGSFRYADFELDRHRERLICVREDHSKGGHEPINSIVALPGTILAAGADFYSNPRLSYDGMHLAWLCWRHPNMPWDGTELWVGQFSADANALTDCVRVAGGEAESVFQPEWSSDGTLYFVSDRTGWWNLHRWRDGVVEQVIDKAAEFGLPQWVFGMSTYAVVSPGKILCAYSENGFWQIAWIDTERRTIELVATDFTDVTGLRANDRQAVFVAGSPRMAQSIVRLSHGGKPEVVRGSSSVTLEEGFVSEPEPIEFPTGQGRTAHAFYYPPRHVHCEGTAGDKPPLLVKIHGGPTSATSTTLNLMIQYWTSRGFGLVDVNYGGSTGYGRAYRERLNGQWGIVDVADCVHAARYLADQGKVDPDRLAIRGGSAGGFTTLAALTFHDVFRAGASYYGVCDLEALARDTHKFEARYLDRLVGPYPARADIYRDRSPIHSLDRLRSPLILFQGLEDKVVPPDQSVRVFEALKAKGVPVAYLPFEGEQHGFRQAATIKRSLDAELYFYGKVFGFEPSDAVAPVAIENL